MSNSKREVEVDVSKMFQIQAVPEHKSKRPIRFEVVNALHRIKVTNWREAKKLYLNLEERSGTKLLAIYEVENVKY